MTKYSAITVMKDGHKVRHRYFSPDEWMKMTPKGDYVFEDGVVCSPSFFWMDRRQADWDIDWEIVND